jgi:hypothetical protein
MAGAGGLAVILVGALIAIGLSLGTIAAAVYALAAKDPRRGFKLGLAAVAGATLAIVLSSPFWVVVLRGRDTHGERLVYPESWPLAALVVFEGAVLVAAVGGSARQHRRAQRESRRSGSARDGVGESR